MKAFSVKQFDVARFDAILARGLSMGMGKQGQQVCIEAAICETLGLEHSDDPQCVAASVRSFKIRLNDSNWSSPKARAEGLRDLGLAQLGSLGVVNDVEFTKRLAEETIRHLIPDLFERIFIGNERCLLAAKRCRKEGTKEAAYAAANAAYAAANAANAAANAANAAAVYAAVNAYAAAYAATYAAAYAANAVNAADNDKPLIQSAQIALKVLRELKSPGVALLEKVA